MAVRGVSKTLGLAALLALTACPDPAGQYQDFLDETKDVRKASGGGCTATAPTDISGSSLLYIYASLTQEYLYFRADISNYVATGGGASFDVTIQPLASPGNKKCTPFTPVGTIIVANGVQVDGSGNFVIDFGNVTVDHCVGALNAYINATIQLRGVAVSQTRWAGGVTGHVFQPLDSPLSPPGDAFVGIVYTTFPSTLELVSTFPFTSSRAQLACECTAGLPGC